MNSDSPINTVDSDEPGPRLREAIAQICAVPAPRDAMMRVLTQAANWPADHVPLRRRWLFRVAAAAAIAILGLQMLVHWRGDRTTRIASPIAQVPTQPTTAHGGTAAPSSQNSGAFGGAAGGQNPIAGADGAARPFGGTPAAPRGGMAGAYASRYVAIAADAPILVSSGGEQPILFGDKRPHGEKDAFIHVWDWSKGNASRPLKVSCGTGMAITPDGKTIVTRDERVIDAATGEIKPVENLGPQVQGLCFAPDGRTLLAQVVAAKDVAAMRLLDFPACKLRAEIPGQWSYTFACAFTPDSGQLLTMDKDRVVHRWDAKTGKELCRYEPALSNSIRSIVVSADQKWVAIAGTRPEDMYLCEFESGKLVRKLSADQGRMAKPEAVYSLAFSPDGRLIAGGGIFNVVFWETATGKITKSLPAASGGAIQIRFSPDGRQLSAVRDFHGNRDAAGNETLVYPSVSTWDIETGKEVREAPDAAKGR